MSSWALALLPPMNCGMQSCYCKVVLLSSSCYSPFKIVLSPQNAAFNVLRACTKERESRILFLANPFGTIIPPLHNLVCHPKDDFLSPSLSPRSTPGLRGREDKDEKNARSRAVTSEDILGEAYSMTPDGRVLDSPSFSVTCWVFRRQ